MTRGNPPRNFTADEMEQFRKQERELGRLQIGEKERRRSARANSFTAKEADRVIGEVKEATRNSESCFAAVGGAGSSTHILAQGQVVMLRGRAAKSEEKAAAKAASNAEQQAATAAKKAAEAKQRADRTKRSKCG